MNKIITIVSGLPRSGTSMMMRMLEAGGTPVLVDGIRTADEDNPRGYYEFERVKQIKTDKAWLDEAEGKVVKMVSSLLVDLPEGRQYKVVFMRRDLEEVLRSQKKMLENRHEANDVEDAEMKRMFIHHLAEMEDWARTRSDVEMLYVNYSRTVESPRDNAERVNRFLGGQLDVDKMVAVVEATLYRQRK